LKAPNLVAANGTIKEFGFIKMRPVRTRNGLAQRLFQGLEWFNLYRFKRNLVEHNLANYAGCYLQPFKFIFGQACPEKSDTSRGS
jgi:hypothetical protein